MSNVAARAEVLPLADDLLQPLQAWLDDPEDKCWVPPSPMIALGLLAHSNPFAPCYTEEFRSYPGAIPAHDAHKRAALQLALNGELEAGPISSYLDDQMKPNAYYFVCMGGLLVNGLAAEMAGRQDKVLPDPVTEVKNSEPLGELTNIAGMECLLSQKIHPELPKLLADFAWKFYPGSIGTTRDVFDSATRAAETLLRAFEVIELGAKLHDKATGLGS